MNQHGIHFQPLTLLCVSDNAQVATLLIHYPPSNLSAIQPYLFNHTRSLSIIQPYLSIIHQQRWGFVSKRRLAQLVLYQQVAPAPILLRTRDKPGVWCPEGVGPSGAMTMNHTDFLTNSTNSEHVTNQGRDVQKE